MEYRVAKIAPRNEVTDVFNGLFDVYIERQCAAVASAVHAGLFFFAFQQCISLAHDKNTFERGSYHEGTKKSQQGIYPAGFLVLTIKN